MKFTKNILVVCAISLSSLVSMFAEEDNPPVKTAVFEQWLAQAKANPVLKDELRNIESIRAWYYMSLNFTPLVMELDGGREMAIDYNHIVFGSWQDDPKMWGNRIVKMDIGSDRAIQYFSKSDFGVLLQDPIRFSLKIKSPSGAVFGIRDVSVKMIKDYIFRLQKGAEWAATAKANSVNSMVKPIPSIPDLYASDSEMYYLIGLKDGDFLQTNPATELLDVNFQVEENGECLVVLKNWGVVSGDGFSKQSTSVAITADRIPIVVNFLKCALGHIEKQKELAVHAPIPASAVKESLFN